MTPTTFRVRYGSSGHTWEYVITSPSYDHENFWPQDLEEDLRAALPEGWWLENRGSRLEVHPLKADRRTQAAHDALCVLLEDRGTVEVFEVVPEHPRSPWALRRVPGSSRPC